MILSSASFPVVLRANETAVSGILLIGAFASLLLGAEIFTNGIEWLGQSLGLDDSATGSVLAAVGTALPETMIPVIAIVSGHLSAGQPDAVHGIGVGAILGAPFLLATVAMFLVGVSVWYFRRQRGHGDRFYVNAASSRRDLSFFLVGYTLAFVAAFVPGRSATIGIGLSLVGLYGAYIYRSLQANEFTEDKADLQALYLGSVLDSAIEPIPRRGPSPHQANDPDRWLVGLQAVIALGFIGGGAQLFVEEIGYLSTYVFDMPGAVLSLLLAPLATELPEKLNSVLWISRDKDTLALGNITGAMAFQGTLPVTLGILFTPWDLSVRWGTLGFLNAFSAVLAVVSGLILYVRIHRLNTDRMRPAPFLIGGLFYLLFIGVVVYHVVVLGLTTVPGN